MFFKTKKCYYFRYMLFFHLGKGRVVNLNPSPSPKKKNNMSVRICLLLQNVSEMFPIECQSALTLQDVNNILWGSLR